VATKRVLSMRADMASCSLLTVRTIAKGRAQLRLNLIPSAHPCEFGDWRSALIALSTRPCC